MSVIVGTAGHVDHGKTVLIKALTGIDTDRLKEEKDRGISIELGFAPLRLPSGRVAGVVDVPGHERFIHNMLAGAGGMDLVILVVDATEGVMPQTREHLDILNLLCIKKGIVVLTKIDLVEEDWLELVEEEVREQLQGSFLEGAPFFHTSVVTGRGITRLKEAIDRLTGEVVARDTSSPLRLPIDRVFLKTGFGLVITGTLFAGQIKVGEIVEVLPPGVEARVRGIQVHGRQVECAESGQRVALNLSGLEKEQVGRGAVVVPPRLFRTTKVIDARLQLLPQNTFSLKHGSPVHFYLGTSRSVARVLLLNVEEVPGGEGVYCQLRLEKELVAQRGDRFIIRSYSPVVTIGGGVVLDESPQKHKRFRVKVIENLQMLEKGTAEFILQKLKEKKWGDLKTIQTFSKISEEQVKQSLSELTAQKSVVQKGDFYFIFEQFQEWREKLQEAIAQFHLYNPLLIGIPRARLKTVLPTGFPPKSFEEMLVELVREKKIELQGDVVKKAAFSPSPGPKDQKILHRIKEMYRQGHFDPPPRKGIAAGLGLTVERLEPYLQFLVYEQDLVKFTEEMYLDRKTYQEALAILVQFFNKEDRLVLSQYRDLTGSSRRVAQSILEYFDGKGFTRRIGDERVSWKLPHLYEN